MKPMLQHAILLSQLINFLTLTHNFIFDLIVHNMLVTLHLLDVGNIFGAFITFILQKTHNTKIFGLFFHRYDT